ncbi:MAG: glycosyltransferase family 4 protein [Planctomycetota bacterium]
MTILHVITRLILGGAQQNTVMSCGAQVAAGHDVHLAYGPIHGPEGSLLEEAKASGATLHEINSLVRQVSPVRDWRCYWAIRRLVRELQPDIVHTHSSKAGIVGRAGAWAERKKRSGTKPTRVIHTVHGLPFNDKQRWIIREGYVGLEQMHALQCDHLIAITDAMVEAFAEKNIAPRDKFTVIPSGVEIDRFAGPALTSGAPGSTGCESGAGARPPTIGLVARLDPLKGHRDLIAALPCIMQGVPHAKVVFVGDGFDREGILSAIDASPHRDRIELKNLVPFDAMPAMYREVDVCVLPSYQEGQSRVLVEALAAGCGVVAYDVGGIPEVCVHETTGLLVSVGDTQALGDEIVRMLTDHALRRRLVSQGQAHVHENFSAEKMNRELLELYERLLA